VAPRLKKILVRLGILLVLLAILAVAGFTWFAYWPLEGSVPRVEALVPEDVDFLIKTSWPNLSSTGWIDQNVAEDPLVPALEAPLAELRRGLEQLEAEEARINEQIPFGIKFSVLGDVVPSDIVAAGRWCEGSGPERGPPRWREILVLTRVSWKAKFFAALKHEFVRKRLGNQVTAEDVGDGIYRFTLRTVIPSPARERQVCGPGVEIPPENVWYGFREKDVLAFSNSEDLIRQTAYVAQFPAAGRSFVNRPNVVLEVPRGGLACAMDLQPLQQYLLKGIERVGKPFTVLQRFLTVQALDRMNGTLALPAPDEAAGRAELFHREAKLPPGAQDAYRLPVEPLKSGVSLFVPAEDTFLTFMVRSPPLHLLEAIYEDILSEAERKIWDENARRMGRYEKVPQFLAEFATKLGDTSGIAVARVSEVFDKVEYAEMYTNDPMANPDASAANLASTFVVQLREGTTPQELDAYLAERIPLLGASDQLERKEYRGFTYTRLKLVQNLADFALVQPAYVLAQDYLIFCSNETYFRKILDAIADPKSEPPLTTDPTFLAVTGRLPERVHVGLFVDLDKLLRVPPDARPGGQPRGWLWDRRNLHVLEHHNKREEGKRYFANLVREFQTQHGRLPTKVEEVPLWDQVNAYIEGEYLGRYEVFLDEYRQSLERLGRLRGLGAAVVGSPRALVGDLVFLVKPRDEP
jgi:hypothetical protein